MDCGVMSSCVWSPVGHAGLVSAVSAGVMSGCPPVMTEDPCGSILELRKEKSRDAARSRRGKENYEFYELAKMLPLPAAITSQLDKASIIRLTISYLKLRDFSSHGDPPWNRDGPPLNKSIKGGPGRRRNLTGISMEMYEMHQGTHILQSLDGFTFALANDGRFLYISETVSIYLGLSQLELTGSSIFDYVHPKDHPELADQLGLCLSKVEMTGSSIFDYIHHHDQSEVAEQLGIVTSQGSTMPSPGSAASDEGSSSVTTPRPLSPSLQDRAAVMSPGPGQGYTRSFCIRMKSTLTKRGVHVKSSGYRVVHILARMRPQFSFSLSRKHPPPVMGLVAMAIALPPPTVNELLIDSDMFVTRLSPEFKITYCEPRISDLMDISSDDLINKNLYDVCHAQDLQKMRKSHLDLLTKGQVLTEYYRLLNKHGGYIWLQTCATTICNNKNPDDQNIIAVNYVLSGIEYGGCVMDTSQMDSIPKNDPETSNHSESETGSDKDEYKREDSKHVMEKPEKEISSAKPGQKRKHSSSQGDTRSVHIPTNRPSITSKDSSILSYSDKSDDNYNSVYVDEGKCGITNERHRLDSKNSRRKMERPRKRKRESESEHEEAECGTESSPKCVENLTNTSNVETGSEIGNSSSSVQKNVQSNVLTSPQDVTLRIRSPGTLPEDLSVKQPEPSNMANSPPPHSNSESTPTPQENGKEMWSTASSPHSTPDPHCEASVSSSVRDLEEVMNKHLPSLPSETDPLRTGFHADFATTHAAALSFQKHKSTIQWIGSQQPATETHPAASLLRHLYASRESVIRTNVYNARPQFYSDMQASLLTPPAGNEAAYKDAAAGAHFNASQMTAAKTQASADYMGLSTYSTNPISVTMSAGSESYSMTPPSSVSPQEKYPSPYTEPCYDVAANQFRQYMVAAEGATLPMPIKPQAYPLPAHAHTSTSYDRTGPQYMSPPGYYATGAGFPVYNTSPTPAHYHENTKNGNAW